MNIAVIDSGINMKSPFMHEGIIKGGIEISENEQGEFIYSSNLNDEQGHEAGDQMLWSAASIISETFGDDEIYRAGGDEFYIFAPDYSEARLERFMDRIKEYTAEYNEENDNGYKVEYSLGAYIAEVDSRGRIEDYIKVSDARMYEQKTSKPGRRH